MRETPAGFTGTILGEPATNTKTGEVCQQVFEYENGDCTDRYVTILKSGRR